MSSYTYSFLIISILCLSHARYITDDKVTMLSKSNNTKNSNQGNKTLKGSYNDIDLSSINIFEDTSGYAWYAKGILIIYNTQYYTEVKCGYSIGEPTYSERESFATSYIQAGSTGSKLFNLTLGTKYKADDRFSCYACDEDYCWGRYYTLTPTTSKPTSKPTFRPTTIRPTTSPTSDSSSSSSSGLSVGIIIGIVVVALLVLCLCICGCCLIYRSKTSMSSRSGGNLPVVTAGIPVTNDMNINQVVNSVPFQNNMYEIPIYSGGNTTLPNTMSVNPVVNTTSLPVTNNVNVNPVMPINNGVVYAVQNADGTVDYYAAAAITSM